MTGSRFARGPGPVTCERCGCGLVARDVWAQMTPIGRQAARETGRAECRVAGFCNACYAYLRRHDELPARLRINASIDPTRPCTRCGISGVLANLSICPDCADVTTDLSEVGLWISDPPAELVPA